MCRFIWEWIYAKQIAPRDTRGHLGGFRGSNIQKSREAVKRLDRLAPTLDSSGNINTSRPSIPQGAWRGVGGSNIQKSWKAVKRLDRLAPNSFGNGLIWEWTQAKNNSTHDTPGRHFGWFYGINNSKFWEMWSNGWTDWE